MDITKFHIPTLDGPNWGLWLDKIQSTARILNTWDVIRGEILTMNPITRDLLAKPSQPGANATAAELATYTTTKAIWSKKNAQGLGLIQATVSNMIWQKHESLGTAKAVLDALETEFRAAGGAQSYLQLVNMVKLQFTDSTNILPQIQQFQDNYNLIMSNSHSRLSKDLATFMFCSSLPDSYELTARQYLDNITSIANYKISDIIALMSLPIRYSPMAFYFRFSIVFLTPQVLRHLLHRRDLLRPSREPSRSSPTIPYTHRTIGLVPRRRPLI